MPAPPVQRFSALARRLPSTVVAGALFAFSAGCAHLFGGKCETPAPAYVALRASDHLNPDARGRSLPTQVKVLQLKGTGKLQTADFRDVWGKADEVLGDELVAQEELTVEPGQLLTRWVARKSEATHVAVVALFRQPAGDSWRSVASLAPVRRCASGAEPPARPSGDDAQVRFALEDFRVIPDNG